MRYALTGGKALRGFLAAGEQRIKGKAGLFLAVAIRDQLVAVLGDLIQPPLVDVFEPGAVAGADRQVTEAPRRVIRPGQLE